MSAIRGHKDGGVSKILGKTPEEICCLSVYEGQGESLHVFIVETINIEMEVNKHGE